MNVLEAMNTWIGGTIPNEGFIIKHSNSKESDTSDYGQLKFFGKEKEMLVQYAERKLTSTDTDYFIFGHRHLPLDVSLSNGSSKYYGLGDWTEYQSYGVLDKGAFSLHYYNTENKTKIIL